MNPRDISIVIPTLDEEPSIGSAIASAIAAGAGEIIVSDGGSRDATCLIATEAGASKMVRSLPGRGTQQNSGASVASRDWLLFLHADNVLDPNCLNQICDRVLAPGSTAPVTWGAFQHRIDSNRTVFRWIERGNAARVRWLSRVFGDQGLFVRREVFRQVGGFADVPLMEDVEFSKRLRKIAKPVLLDGPITISDRRWKQNGVVRQTLRNWSIQYSFAMGASPEKLRRRYR